MNIVLEKIQEVENPNALGEFFYHLAFSNKLKTIKENFRPCYKKIPLIIGTYFDNINSLGFWPIYSNKYKVWCAFDEETYVFYHEQSKVIVYNNNINKENNWNFGG